MLKTFDELLKNRANDFPNVPFWVTSERHWTFKAVEQETRLGAQMALEKGIGKGTRVAFVPENNIETLLQMVSWLRVQAVLCPISNRFPLKLSKQLCKQIEATCATDTFEKAKPLPVENATTIIFTSGSSDTPKAAVHTLANHYYSAIGSNENIPFRSGDRWLLTLPLYHVSGLSIFFRCFFTGATLVLRDHTALSHQIRSDYITHLSLVHTQLGQLLSEQGHFPNLKAILLGGSAFPQDLLIEGKKQKLPLYLSYGMTETASQIATTPPNAPLKSLLRASGKVLPHRVIKIENNGEICVGGDVLFAGYWTKKGLVSMRDEDGFFHTGDLGRFISGAELQILGRKDEMFISGGENIQPQEIEAELIKIKGIKQAFVVAKEDAQYGKVPVAFLETATEFDFLSILPVLEQKLPRFKIPKEIRQIPTHLLQSGLKISRKALREYLD